MEGARMRKGQRENDVIPFQLKLNQKYLCSGDN